MEPQQQAIQAQGGNSQPLPSLFQNILSRTRQMEQGSPQDPQQDQTQQPTTSNNNQGAVSQALGILGDKSTSGQIGQAIQTPNYAGYCLKWVDDQTGNSQRQPTAYADYQVNVRQGNIQTSTDSIPKGARVYFSPNSTNGNMGHIGLSNGDGTFTSATDNGVKTFDIADWDKYAGQQFLGWAPPNSA